MSVNDNEAIYPISVAAKLLSVHPRTLRIYEEEDLIQLARHGNKRVFSNDDIKWIRCLRTLIHDRGISIPGIKMLLELTPCWEIKKCSPETRKHCSAYVDRSLPCWKKANSVCARDNKHCEKCEVYQKAMQRTEKQFNGAKKHRFNGSN